jgi:hypothetical protein
MLRFNCFRAAALLDLDFLILDFSDQINHAPSIRFVVRRVSIDLGFDNGTRQGRLLIRFSRRDAQRGESTV